MTDDATRVSDTDATIPAADLERGTSPPDPKLPGQRYRLGAELGRGGMGRVVEAFDVQLGRTVAFKEVLTDRAGIDRRFMREIQITARLEHPAIVPLYDSGVTADGRLFYVMRKVTGKPLDNVIARAASVGERLAQLPAVLAAIDAVAHAHRRGVIHRDLKPANILVGELGETVVIDWGLAKVIGEDDHPVEPMAASDSLHTQIGSVFGTPGFMAPEQARGDEMGKGGDVYALGATLYQLLAGKPPHRGKSATEVLSSTMRNVEVSYGEEILGAPADLVAIVKKALAFEVADRYPDAVALGEDVRRFLAGQLVAAHQYTTGQRLARFGKRHRGVLGVAAIATVAVAGLAWYGVHRILDERDRADEERQHALAENATAKRRLIEVQDRDERRIVANARAILDTNPTAAIAMLKQLPATSKHVDEARTVAQAAVARGVVWGMQTTSAYAFQNALSPSGNELLQLTNDGWARLWDLDHHKLAWQRKEPDPSARMTWLADGKHLIVRHDKAPPELVDVVAVARESLPIASMRALSAAPRADRIVYADDAGALHRFEVGARKDTPLPIHVEKDASFAISPDGSFFAVNGAKRVTVYTADGVELAHRDGQFVTMEFSDTGRFAAFGVPDVVELTLATPAAWDVVPLPPQRSAYAFALGGYLGDRLIITADAHVYAWRDKLSTWLPVGETSVGGFAIAGELAIVETTEAHLKYSNGFASGDIPLPMAMAHLRLIGRTRLNRLLVIGDGMLLDLPLDAFASHPLEKTIGETPTFVTNDALLYTMTGEQTMRWLDLGTGKRTVVGPMPPGFEIAMSTDEHDGRALVTQIYGNVNGNDLAAAPTRLVLARHGETSVRTVASGVGLFGVLVHGGGILYADAAGKLWGLVGDAEPHELAKLEGRVTSIVPREHLGFAAYTDKGELVRGALDNPAVEKIFTRRSDQVQLASDASARVYIALGTRLSRWDADLVEIAELGKPITSLSRGAGGMIAGVDGGEYFLVEEGAAPARILAAGSMHVALGDGGRMLIAFGQSSALQVVELPSRVMWSVPAAISNTGHATLSPDGRTLVYEEEAGAMFSLVRTLVTGPADLAAWLDELTNATADEAGLVVWPWQAP